MRSKFNICAGCGKPIGDDDESCESDASDQLWHEECAMARDDARDNAIDDDCEST